MSTVSRVYSWLLGFITFAEKENPYEILHSRTLTRRRHLGLLFLIMALLGCGESTKDAMIRIAKQRAAAKEKAAKEAENAPKEGGDATAPAEPQSASANTTQVADATANPATATANKPEQVAQPVPVVPQPQAQASSPPPTPSPAPVATNLPTVSSLASRNLLKFDSQGQLVAAMGEGNNVSVHDVATKAIVRNAFNESLAPTAIAVDANRGLVAVGGEDGSAKVFPLTSTRGLDRFAQDSLVRRDRNRPYKAHANSLASIAINPKRTFLRQAISVARFASGRVMTLRPESSWAQVVESLPCGPSKMSGYSLVPPDPTRSSSGKRVTHQESQKSSQAWPIGLFTCSQALVEKDLPSETTPVASRSGQPTEVTEQTELSRAQLRGRWTFIYWNR